MVPLLVVFLALGIDALERFSARVVLDGIDQDGVRARRDGAWPRKDELTGRV
jgi:hypothetical protein